MRTAWVNRSGTPFDTIGQWPDLTVPTLGRLPAALRQGQSPRSIRVIGRERGRVAGRDRVRRASGLRGGGADVPDLPGAVAGQVGEECGG
jgi:hypothetical protein